MRALTIAAITFVATLARADTELSMPDVQALAKAQQWTELLARAERVKPAARTTDWARLVTDAATHVVQQLEAASTSGWRTASDLADVVPRAERTYPFLVTDAAYLGAKAKALQSLVPACVHAAEYDCSGFVAALADGITKFPPGTAKSIADLFGANADGVHFWALAIDDDKAVCNDAILARSVVFALRESAVPRQVGDAEHVAATCYAALETALLDELVATPDDATPRPTYLKNACPVLKTHGAMTIAKKKKCS